MTSIIKVDQIQTAAGGVPTAADLGLNVSGTILQAKSGVMTNQYSSTVMDTFVDFGLNVSVTPKRANSHWLIMAKVHTAMYTTQLDWPPHLAAFIGSNKVSPTGDTTNNSRPNVHTASVISQSDAAPDNNQVMVYNTDANLSVGVPYTFSIRGYTGRGYGTWYVNRSVTMYNDDISGSNPISTITVMEIAG